MFLLFASSNLYYLQYIDKILSQYGKKSNDIWYKWEKKLLKAVCSYSFKILIIPRMTGHWELYILASVEVLLLCANKGCNLIIQLMASSIAIEQEINFIACENQFVCEPVCNA